jgi:hypothetical protein
MYSGTREPFVKADTGLIAARAARTRVEKCIFFCTGNHTMKIRLGNNCK